MMPPPEFRTGALAGPAIAAELDDQSKAPFSRVLRDQQTLSQTTEIMDTSS